MESIHELFQRVREHPDFRFGVIFVEEDVEEYPAPPDGRWKWAEEHMTAAGFEYLENLS